ncbi:MAG: DCC1-like thiol-disulfide oxidoreductase family protein [Deltaproteobacteria bacterium]
MAVAGTHADVPDAPIVLYDGECGLCHRSVKFILDHEADHELRFAPLQGEVAAELRSIHPNIPANVDTVVLVAGGRAYLRSKAFLHVAKHLRAPWRWVYAVRWFPGVILDLAYRVIAKIRYRVWGKVDSCELPSPERRARFLA